MLTMRLWCVYIVYMNDAHKVMFNQIIASESVRVCERGWNGGRDVGIIRVN